MSQTRRTYAIRLTAEGGRQVRAELTAVGQTGERELGRVERASRDASRGMEDLSGRASGLSSAIATWNRVLGVMAAATAATAGLQQAVAAYASFEEGLIAVGKTADLSGSALDGFGSRIEALSQRLPIPAEELLRIAQAAGQLGVKGEENILRFTETVARLGSASDLAGEEGATALARLLNVTGESAASVDVLGSVIVALGNNFAATEREIARIANEVGRAASVFGVSSAQAAALAAAMAALGIQAELGGSSVGKALRAMDEAIRNGGEELAALEKLTGRTGEALRRIFAQDATAALQLFLTGLGRVIAGGGDAAAVLDQFGLAGEEILKTLPVMAMRSEEVARALKIANQEIRNARALTEESEKAFASYNAEMARLKNTLSSIARSIGAELAPALATLSRGLRRALSPDSDEERFNKLFKERLSLLEQIQQREAHLKRIDPFSAAGQSISASLLPLRTRLGEIDAVMRRLQDLRIDGLKPPAGAAPPREGVPGARPPALAIGKGRQESKAESADRQLLDELDRERQALALTDRQRFVSQATRRLSAEATTAQRREVERLAGALFDEQQRLERGRKAEETRQRLLERGRSVTESLLTAEERRRERLRELNELLAAGAITQETFNRGMQDADRVALDAGRSWSSGMVRALRDYAREAGDAARTFEDLTTGALRKSEEAFVQWAHTGKFQARDLFTSLADEALKAAYRMAAVQPINRFLESWMGSFSWSGGASGGASAPTSAPSGGGASAPVVMRAHGGGVLGSDRLVGKPTDMGLFQHAPRFHGGGLVPGEVPIIARSGEGIFTPGQMQSLGAGMARRPEVPVTVNIHNYAPGTEARADKRREADGSLTIDVIVEEMEGRMARNVGRGEGLAPVLERRYGLNPAAGAYR